MSFPLYREYAAGAGGAFSELVAYATTHIRINSAGRLRPGSVQVVSGNFFEALGVPPQLGRGFVPSEDAAPMPDAVAVISDGLWKAQFKAAPDVVGRTVTPDERLALMVLGAFASAALALAAVGVYGVTSFAVAARTRALGVRTALGARPATLLALAMRQAMGPLGVGLVFGLAGAEALARVVSGMFCGVSPGDPQTVAAVVGVLGLVATVACLAPAVRATRVDPTAALRHG
jgi:ABC-type antimicrobial peptide transport system permease subunit